MHLLVMAKAPIAGRVKTRLCPPLSAEQAARYAEAALVDTLTAVAACDVDDRVLALEGEPGDWIPEGFRVVPQPSGSFNERLAHAWADADGPGVQIGMDTPQVTVEMLESALDRIAPGRALLGPARDGGWWALGLPAADPEVFTGVAMSRADTEDQQRRRLEALDYVVDDLEMLRDVDHHDDAIEVAATAPNLESSRCIRHFALDARATLLDDE